MGKSHLLHRYVIGKSHDFNASPEGKKTFNNQHKSDQMIVLKV